MTREEIKKGLKFTIDMFKFDPLTGEERTLNKLDAITVNACEEAIKILEQEPFINKPCVSSGVCEHDKEVVLDKIRAEIEEKKKERCFDDEDMFAYRTGLDEAIDIIDKYKAESEDEE